MGCGYKGSLKDALGYENVLYLDCINVNILVVKLYYCFISDYIT